MGCIKQCDICKKVYVPYGNRKDKENPNGFAWLNIFDCCCGSNGGYYVHKPLDVCLECRDRIKEFIEVLGEEVIVDPNPPEELPIEPGKPEEDSGE